MSKKVYDEAVARDLMILVPGSLVMLYTRWCQLSFFLRGVGGQAFHIVAISLWFNLESCLDCQAVGCGSWSCEFVAKERFRLL